MDVLHRCVVEGSDKKIDGVFRGCGIRVIGVEAADEPEPIGYGSPGECRYPERVLVLQRGGGACHQVILRDMIESLDAERVLVGLAEVEESGERHAVIGLRLAVECIESTRFRFEIRVGGRLEL